MGKVTVTLSEAVLAEVEVSRLWSGLTFDDFVQRALLSYIEFQKELQEFFDRPPEEDDLDKWVEIVLEESAPVLFAELPWDEEDAE